MTRVIRLTQPVVEPITLAELKENLRIPKEMREEDTFLYSCISAGRDQAEKFIDRAICQASFRLVLGGCSTDEVDMKQPASSVQQFEYLDYDKNLVAVSGFFYSVETNVVYLDESITSKAIFINYTDGQDSAWDESLKRAVLLLASDYYVGRTSMELMNRAAIDALMPFKHRPIL